MTLASKFGQTSGPPGALFKLSRSHHKVKDSLRPVDGQNYRVLLARNDVITVPETRANLYAPSVTVNVELHEQFELENSMFPSFKS